jgi:hypothetical protein
MCVAWRRPSWRQWCRSLAVGEVDEDVFHTGLRVDVVGVASRVWSMMIVGRSRTA